MMKWFDELIKYRLLRRSLQRLPRYLKKQYGNVPFYSPQQILDAIRELKLSEKYAIYLIAALSDKTASKLYAQEMQLNEDVLLARQEIADLYLGGKRDFTIEDINTFAGVDDSIETDHLGE